MCIYMTLRIGASPIDHTEQTDPLPMFHTEQEEPLPSQWLCIQTKNGKFNRRITTRVLTILFWNHDCVFKWLCLITQNLRADRCMQRPITQELDDLSTDAFLNNLRCFQTIRGQVQHLYCDQGTNFIGAANELSHKSLVSRKSPGKGGERSSFTSIYSGHGGRGNILHSFSKGLWRGCGDS